MALEGMACEGTESAQNESTQNESAQNTSAQNTRPTTPTAAPIGAQGIRRLTQDDIIAFVAELPGVVTVTASEASGAPEMAWGDSFFFYDPSGDTPADRRMPFATIVTDDYDGFDTASDLNRPGVFRVNIAVGRTAFEELIGYPPAAHPAQSARFDYTAVDRLVPHPVYATQAWVAILNPADTTAALAGSLLAGAHALAVRRYGRRHA